MSDGESERERIRDFDVVCAFAEIVMAAPEENE